MIEPADDPIVEHYVAQRLAGALMAPPGVVLSLVKSAPKSELLNLLFRCHAMNHAPDSLAAEFVRAWRCYFDPGEPFLSADLVVNRTRSRPRLDAVVDRICANASDAGKTKSFGRFLQKNAGFSFGGFHIEQAGESYGSAIWTISDDSPEDDSPEDDSPK